jgi:hypothetical protein
LSRGTALGETSQTTHGFFTTSISSLLGPHGMMIAGALAAGFIAYAIWVLARAVGAPRWAAASVASLWVISPLFGFAPSPAGALDDAIFAGFMTIGIAASVLASKREDGNILMAAFILAIIAAALRPGAIWPAIAVGVGAWCASRNLEEGPWVGMLSSLCWAPGLYFAHKIISDEARPASLTDQIAEPIVSQSIKTGAQAGVEAVETASLSLPVIFHGLLSALPFLVYGGLAALGVGILYILGKDRRRGAIAAGIGGLIAILGAAGYGSLAAARLLLDAIFLALAAAIGLVLPALIKRYRARQRQTPSS